MTRPVQAIPALNCVGCGLQVEKTLVLIMRTLRPWLRQQRLNRAGFVGVVLDVVIDVRRKRDKIPPTQFRRKSLAVQKDIDGAFTFKNEERLLGLMAMDWNSVAARHRLD